MAVQDPKFEIFRITVDGVDKGGEYVLRFQNPDTLKWYNTGTISVTASASTVKSRVNSYFWSKYRGRVSVNRTMYLANGTETTSSTNAT
jgi:hypothetical protein